MGGVHFKRAEVPLLRAMVGVAGGPGVESGSGALTNDEDGAEEGSTLTSAAASLTPRVDEATHVYMPESSTFSSEKGKTDIERYFKRA